MKKVSSAEANAHFSELLARAAYSNERIVIQRRGKPVAALVSMKDLERLEPIEDSETEADTDEPWPLKLRGVWKGLMTDEEIDAMTEHIYEERRKNFGREVDLDV